MHATVECESLFREDYLAMGLSFVLQRTCTSI